MAFFVINFSKDGNILMVVNNNNKIISVQFPLSLQMSSGLFEYIRLTVNSVSFKGKKTLAF